MDQREREVLQTCVTLLVATSLLVAVIVSTVFLAIPTGIESANVEQSTVRGGDQPIKY